MFQLSFHISSHPVSGEYTSVCPVKLLIFTGKLAFPQSRRSYLYIVGYISKLNATISKRPDKVDISISSFLNAQFLQSFIDPLKFFFIIFDSF